MYDQNFRGGGKGSDTLCTPPSYEQLLPLPTPYFKMFLERLLDDPPPTIRVFPSGGLGNPPSRLCPLHQSLAPPQKFPENNRENNSLLLEIPPLVSQSLMENPATSPLQASFTVAPPPPPIHHLTLATT